MAATLNVKTEFFPLAFILFLVTPVIEINGEKNSRAWGSSSFELEPGTYQIKIYFPYLFYPECGANEVEVTLAEGETKSVHFNMPPWMLAKGSISVT